jgi:antitoxin component YwqK of YwqJK toxin-antitoxin module
MTLYDPMGHLLQRCHYSAGKLDGPAFFYSQGQLQASVAFRSGVRDGESLAYDEHGQLREQSSYHNGRRCGQAKYYGADGQLVQQASYHNNKLHGTVTQYYPNGMIHEVASYQEHRLHGDVITYAPDGSIVAQRLFCDGKPCDTSATVRQPVRSAPAPATSDPPWFQQLLTRIAGGA